MMPVELKLITERTHDLIAAANHTLEYSKIVIEESKKLIIGINEKRLQFTISTSSQTFPGHKP
jgi:hypothetical protein